MQLWIAQAPAFQPPAVPEPHPVEEAAFEMMVIAAKFIVLTEKMSADQVDAMLQGLDQEAFYFLMLGIALLSGAGL